MATTQPLQQQHPFQQNLNTNDDLLTPHDGGLLSFIQTKAKCLIGCTDESKSEPGLLSQQIVKPQRIDELAQENFTNIHAPSIPDSLLCQYNPTLFKELEFYNSNDPTGSTLSVFDIIGQHTATQTGKTYLKHITSKPTTNLEILYSRQYTIEFIRQNSTIIRPIIQEFKTSESAIYWLLDTKTPEMREVLDIIFFTKSWNKMLNKSNSFIAAYFYFIMIFNPLWGVLGPFVLILIPFLVSRYIMKIPLDFSTYVSTIKATLFGEKFFSMLTLGKQVFNTLTGESANPQTQLRNNLINKGFDIITSELGRWIYLLVIVGGYFWGIYNQILVSYNFNKLINFLHTRLNQLRGLIDGAKKIIKLCDHSTTGLKCPAFSSIAAKCIELINTSPVLKLIAEDPVFLQTPGFFSNKGPIIKVFYMLELEGGATSRESTVILPAFLQLIGYVDGWSAVANSLNSNLTIAEYDVSADRPSLVITNEISPVCAGCVPNSIAMGNGAENNNILLTGPNGSGKSTFLKSVMTNIVLAQTLGVAFAEKIKLTPFAYLSTYLNIPDCQGRESLFQAEMSRCHQHLNWLQELESRPARTGFSFNIMDEIFVSTNYLEGMSGAYAVIKHLGSLNNSCHIITTHFDKLVRSGSSIPGYTNKFFKIELGTDGEQISKDYLLRDGVNDKHLALHLLKLRGFDAGLINDARKMYDELVSNDTMVSNNSQSDQEIQVSPPTEEQKIENIAKSESTSAEVTEPADKKVEDKNVNQISEHEKNQNYSEPIFLETESEKNN